MPEGNKSHGTLVAPSPVIPTYRPSSQSSKRPNYRHTMSALSPKYQQYLSMVDDIQPSDSSNNRTNNESVPEVVRYIQTHVSSQNSSQSTGAREMIKAGQRRLRLALRNKKGTDTKAKANDATRQLLALQHEGYPPTTQPRRTGHKSVGSTTSTAKSVSSLSFKSISKQDVETIGQPWLDDPLEDRDAPGSKGSSSQLSSLDLRDLASFVEAAVNFSSQFENLNPPPYQPPTEWSDSCRNEKPPNRSSPVTPAVSEQMSVSHTSPAAKASASRSLNMADSDGSKGDETPLSSSLSGNTPYTTEHDDKNDVEEVKPKKDSRTPITKVPQPSLPNNSPGSSVPTTPVLKLFPDTMPPRVSSKAALRVANGRSPTPSRPHPAHSVSQKTTSPAVSESNTRDSKVLSNTLSKIQEDISATRRSVLSAPSQHEEPSTVLPESPEYDKRSHAKHAHRPSTLSMGTIEAFPLPAPKRPLPTVPEPVSQTISGSDQKHFAHRKISRSSLKHPDLCPSFDHTPEDNDSKTSTLEKNTSSSSARVTPSPRLVLGAKEPETTKSKVAEIAATYQSRHVPVVRTGRSRAEKVRSLRMKDLAASRIYLNDSNTQQDQGSHPPEAHIEPQTAVSHGDAQTRLDVDRRYQRKVSPAPSSPPPLSPPPSDPPLHPFQGRRYCTSPVLSRPGTIESTETLSLQASNRNSRMCRSSSSRSTETEHEKGSTVSSLLDRSETPLPSSDDEITAGAMYRSKSRMNSGRSRRVKPAPIVVDEPASYRGRSLKKHHSSNMSPPTPQNHKRRGPEKTACSHNSADTYKSYDSQGYHPAESKPNPSLEGRIEHLERQNKILQAALLAALDVGVKQDLSSILGGSNASPSTNATPPLTGRSASSTSNTSASEEPAAGQEKYARKFKASYRPESWIASPDSFGRDSYDSNDSANARELEDMIEEFDLDWTSDSPENQGSRTRF